MKHKPQQLNIQPKAKRPIGKRKAGNLRKNPDDFPCPVCGESDYEWGGLQGIKGFVQAGGMPFNAKQAYARACRACGNVMTFLRE